MHAQKIKVIGRILMENRTNYKYTLKNKFAINQRSNKNIFRELISWAQRMNIPCL